MGTTNVRGLNRRNQCLRRSKDYYDDGDDDDALTETEFEQGNRRVFAFKKKAEDRGGGKQARWCGETELLYTVSKRIKRTNGSIGLPEVDTVVRCSFQVQRQCKAWLSDF